MKTFKKILLFVLLPLFLGLGILLNKYGFDKIEELRSIERIPQVPIAALIPSEANITGLAQVYAGQHLKGPRSNRACLYYLYTIEKETTDSDGNTSWSTVHTETRFVPFLIEDSSGSITVYPHAVTRVTPKTLYTHTEGNYRYTEERIDPGMEVFALGRAVLESEGLVLRFDAPGTYVPILSTEDELYEREALGLTSLLITVAGLTCLSLAMYLLTRLLHIHQTFAYALLVALTLFVCLTLQSAKMIVHDLRLAHQRLLQEHAVRTQEVQHLLRHADFSWDAQWSSLESFLHRTVHDPRLQEQVSRHRIHLFRAFARSERIARGFPERFFVPFMGLSSLETFALLPYEQDQMQAVEAAFTPTRLSGWALLLIPLGFVLSLVLAHYGIKKIRIKRWIENIPTVPTQSVVYGINEIQGTVLLPHTVSPLYGPLSNAACVVYKYLVEEERGSGKNKKWVTITDEKKQIPFLCQDASGAIAVLPDKASHILDTHSQKTAGKFRYTEHRLALDAEVYVLGYAIPDPQGHARLVMAASEDKSFPYLISDLPEEELIAKKASRGFLLLNFGLNAFMLAGFGVAGWLGGFGAVAYMIAGLSPILYLILFMSVVMYNDLIFLRLRCDSMRANIDVALKKRFDLLPRLLETVQAFFRHEQKMQEELTDLRAGKHAHGKILGIMEKYPELKGHHLSTRLMEELRMLEDDIAFMREGYNHAVLVYNTRIEKIPELVLARAFHFMPQAYFQDL